MNSLFTIGHIELALIVLGLFIVGVNIERVVNNLQVLIRYQSELYPDVLYRLENSEELGI